jgi:hypothetical protein
VSLRTPDLPIPREFPEPGIDSVPAPTRDACSRATRLEEPATPPELAERLGRTARRLLLGQLPWLRGAERIDSALAAA